MNTKPTTPLPWSELSVFGGVSGQERLFRRVEALEADRAKLVDALRVFAGYDPVKGVNARALLAELGEDNDYRPRPNSTITGQLTKRELGE